MSQADLLIINGRQGEGGGQVLFAGSPADLVRDPNVRRLYLGESFEL